MSVKAVLRDFILDLGQENEREVVQGIRSWLRENPARALELLLDLKVLSPWVPAYSPRRNRAHITSPEGAYLANPYIIRAGAGVIDARVVRVYSVSDFPPHIAPAWRWIVDLPESEGGDGDLPSYEADRAHPPCQTAREAMAAAQAHMEGLGWIVPSGPSFPDPLTSYELREESLRNRALAAAEAADETTPEEANAETPETGTSFFDRVVEALAEGVQRVRGGTS